MKLLLFVATTLVAFLAASAQATCIPETQNGSVNCQSSCKYAPPPWGPYCEVDPHIRYEDYCYQDYVVNTCHNGSGDPCCDTEGI